MNKEQELRPCPLCQRNVEAVQTEADYEAHREWYIECLCGIEMHDRLLSSLITRWNRRSSDEQAEVVGPAAWALEGKLRDGGTDLRLPFLTKQEDADRYQARNPDEVLVPLYRAPAVAAGGVTARDIVEQCAKAAEAFNEEHGDPADTLHHGRSIIKAIRSLAVGDEGIRETLSEALRFISDIDNAHPVVRKLRAALKDTTHAE